MKYISLILISFFSLKMYSQVGIGTVSPDPSAIVELKSYNSGFLIPRMTLAERNLITNPTEGLMIYNTERNAIQFYRENVGVNNDLSGWFDTRCENDINTAISNFPSGIILDFSDFDNNGNIFSGINGGGTQLNSSSPNLSQVGSIGPLPTDLNDPVPVLTNYISFTNKSETGNLGNSDYRFRLLNDEGSLINKYNAVSFMNRTHRATSNPDIFEADFNTSYTGDFDIIVVARFDEIPTIDKESIFSTGNFYIGGGANGQNCKRNHFTFKRNSGSNAFNCGHNNNPNLDKKVEIDTDFHRFRVKSTHGVLTEFYIDGVLIGSATNNFSIERLGLFINNADQFAPKSSISFIGIFKSILSENDFDRFDQFLACKFESQP